MHRNRRVSTEHSSLYAHASIGAPPVSISRSRAAGDPTGAVFSFSLASSESSIQCLSLWQARHPANLAYLLQVPRTPRSTREILLLMHLLPTLLYNWMVLGSLVPKSYALEPPHPLLHHLIEEYSTMEGGELYPRSMRSPGFHSLRFFYRHCAGYMFRNGCWRGGWAPMG